MIIAAICGVILFAYYAGRYEGAVDERIRIVKKLRDETGVSRKEALSMTAHGKRKITKTDLSPDLDFINAIIEQDTVANIRYGILVLLALSSLGVYSIILAG